MQDASGRQGFNSFGWFAAALCAKVGDAGVHLGTSLAIETCICGRKEREAKMEKRFFPMHDLKWLNIARRNLDALLNEIEGN